MIFYFQVQFDGEDAGGLSREFFTLIGKEIGKSFWECGTIHHYTVALKVHV